MGRGVRCGATTARDDHPMADELEFTCPRCGEGVVEDVYGPCGPCREVLRTTLGRAGRAVEQTEYEPKVNVTPNAVATKD